jgi:hypothetical protein
MKENATSNEIRPVFSGHGTFPMRYGWLKKVFDACMAIENKNGSISKGLFNNEESIVILGVGKNMVASMRYWAIYSGILDIGNNKEKNIRVNNFAKELFADDGLDPWLENYATLWYIHWNLVSANHSNMVSNECLFTYHWFFNYYNASTFDKRTIIKRIEEVLKDKGLTKPSDLTLDRDVGCLTALYATKSHKNKSNEESIESPLSELELISPITRRDVFQINRGIKPNLSIYTFLFALLMFWKNYSPNAKSLSLESVCYGTMSPGKVFLINEDAIAGFMQDISDATNGTLGYSETAGMKQILLLKDIKNFEDMAIRLFKRNYK